MSRIGSAVFERVSAVVYWALNWFARGVMFTCARFTIEGYEHVPRSGAFVLASNHMGMADPPVLAASTRRRVVFMAKREIVRWPLVGQIIYLYGVVSVRRFGADLSALRRSQAILRRGDGLGMFPEGTRARGDGLGRPWPGTAVIALRTNALIVPAAIWGTRGFLWPRVLWAPVTRPRITVRFGEPFHLPETKRASAEDARRGVTEIMRRIAELLPAEHLGEYGRAVLAGESPPVAVEEETA